jgi:hypothetical protein
MRFYVYYNANMQNHETVCTYAENTQNAWKFLCLGEFKIKIKNILGG